MRALAASGVRVRCLALRGVDLISLTGKLPMGVIGAVVDFDRDVRVARAPHGCGMPRGFPRRRTGAVRRAIGRASHDGRGQAAPDAGAGRGAAGAGSVLTGADALTELDELTAPELALDFLERALLMAAMLGVVLTVRLHSLRLLQRAKELDPGLFTKSGIMVGLGEERGAVLQVMDDMRAAGVDFLTVGQYLQPTPRHHAVARFVPPEEFAALERAARGKGFAMVSATPLTRSSYHAGVRRQVI